VKVPVLAHQWHMVRVDFAGTHFSVAFNGKPLFEVEDDRFADAGRDGPVDQGRQCHGI